MAGSEDRPRQTDAIVEEARALLSKVALKANPQATTVNDPQENKGIVGARVDHSNQEDGRVTGAVLARCVTLLEDFTRLSSTDFIVDGQSWTVLKAVTELLVRFGICPFLSDGVGIPVQKRFGENAAKAVATAVSDHLVQEEDSGLTDSDTSSEARESFHPLVLSTEFLSSLLLKDDPRSSSVATSSRIPESHGSDPSSTDGREQKQGNSGREDGEDRDCGFPSPSTSLGQLILSHHLVDVLAGVLEIGYGPLLNDLTRRSVIQWSREKAAERMKVLAEMLPVEYVVEALFILLGSVPGKGPGPPPWLKSEVGRLLSLVVMRDGGVAAVLERLVGKAEKGSMKVFVKVATQLARVPRSVATKDEYYKDVCKQLHPLLILRHSHSRSASSSGMAVQVLDNMQITAILLACKMTLQAPDLVERHLTRPIVEPLLTWGALQPQLASGIVTSSGAAVSIDSEPLKGDRLSEDLIVNSFLKVQNLLTAGHEGSRGLRQQLLRLTEPLTSSLIALSYLLWPLHTKAGGLSQEQMGIPETTVHMAESVEEMKDQERGIDSGEDNPSNKVDLASLANAEIGELSEAIFDFVQAHLADPSRQLAPFVCQFLLNVGSVSLIWPPDGDIADVLAAGRRQANSAAIFVSKLLQWSENWELVLALLGVLLGNIFKLESTRMHAESDFVQKRKQELRQRLVEDLEVIVEEIGLYVAQQETCQSLQFVEGVFGDERLVQDEELLVKILRLLGSTLSRLQYKEDAADGRGVTLDRVQADMLSRLSNSLERLRLQLSCSEIPILNECNARLKSMTTAC